MRSIVTATCLAAWLLAGCQYEAPLATEHGIAIDAALPGAWEPVPEEASDGEKEAPWIVLAYSDTEYLVHHPLGKGELYYRAYPVQLGGVSCLQLQVIGTEEGPLREDQREQLFQVVSYARQGDRLEVRLLNTALVGKDLSTTAALQKAFLEHKAAPDLFNDPMVFRRVAR